MDPPCQKVITQTVAAFTITSVYVNPFNSAVVSARMFDENNNPLAGNCFLMEGEDYNQWNNDDNYLVTFVANQIRAMPSLN
jgi:hypothetical protein